MILLGRRSPVFRDGRLILTVAGFGLLGFGLLISAVAADWAVTILATLYRLRDLGWAGQAIFVLLQAAVALIGFLPASLLGLAAGAIYGAWIGFGLAATGVMVAAVIAFGLARSALRPSIIHLLDSRTTLGGFDTALAGDGWRLVALMRVSPVMPF
jgi:uncharacterized membrane protein YdjX (TVP38/TMEM64 family)